jgi:hypothetical protein
MTVIAWDGMQLASDSALSAGGCINRASKIDRMEVTKARPVIGSPGLVLFGAAGHPEALQLVREFLTGETDKLDLDTDDETFAEVIMASVNGAWLWSGLRPIRLLGGPAAIGVGAKAALGAMHHGASAAEAVATAIEFCDECAGPVQSLALPPVV